MAFQGRYQILEMVSEGETRTFKALQTSSGRIVLLHQLWVERTPPDQPDLAALVFAFLRSATAEEMKSLVNMGEEENRVFVVTENLPGCQDLRQWLQSKPGTLGPVGKSGVSISVPIRDSDATAATRGLVSHARQEDLAPSEPTQLFTVPKVIADQGLSAPLEKRPEQQPPAGFEVVFGSTKQQSRGPVPPAVEAPLSPPPPVPGSESGAPGDFTRVFYGRDESKAVPPSPKPAAESTRLPSPSPGRPSQSEGAGEFTKLFQAQHFKEKPPAPPSVKAEQSQPFAQPSKPTSQNGPGDFMRRSSAVQPEAAGEFTQLFGVGPQPTQPTGPPIPTSSPQTPVPFSSPSSRQGPGELTQMFQGYQPKKSESIPPLLERPEPVVQAPPSKAEKAKPGEFTLIFQQPSEPTPPPSPVAPSPAVAQTPPPAPQSPEPDEYMRLFELPSGGAGAPPPRTPQAAPPAAPQPAAGRAAPVIPTASVSPPMAPSAPYVQTPVAPQPPPYQAPAPPSPFAMPSQPAMPQMQPIPAPAPVAPQAAPPKTGASKFLVPLIILGGLFLVAVVLILVLVLKH